jgi:hypothetical protein
MGAKIKAANGSTCGEVIGDVYCRAVKGSTAFFKKFGGGIANSIHELNEAEKAGAVKVRITDLDNGCMFIASIAHIREVGKPIEFAGYGRQLLLGFNGWIKTTKGQKIPESVTQLSLWGQV